VLASPSRVQLAHDSGLDCSSAAFQRAAGKHDDTATLAAAHELGMKFTSQIMAAAARCNKLAEVQYLHSRGCPWSSRLLEGAASSNFFELLRWCYEQGCPWDANTSRWAPAYAADSGNVEMMTWLLQQPGMHLSESVSSNAAAKGHMVMCKYLYALHCPWETSNTCRAALGDHADVLRWLLDNGCPCKVESMCLAAARGGSLRVMAFLQQQGLLSVPLLTLMLASAGGSRCKHIAAAKWLRAEGAEWPTTRFHCGPWVSEVRDWAIAEGFTPPSI
jgi:hypothetical protein